MRRATQISASLGLAAVLAMAVTGCGGGETAVIGFANSGNKLATDGVGEEVAEALAENPSIPEVTDEIVAEIYGAILKDARAGNPEAALIVLKIAEEQREEAEE